MNGSALSTREVSWISLALLLGLAPHMQRFSVLLSVAFGLAIVWRILGAMGRLPLPDRQHLLLWVAKQIVAVGAFVTVYIAYHGQLGREAGIELLAALLGLKVLEMSNDRDYYVVAFLCYFLIVTNFFYSQTMGTAVYMLALVIAVTTVLVQFNTPIAYRSTRAMFALGARMTAQAVPLMLISFFLFPRVPGPLWGLPQDAFDGMSGLSEEMEVGQIARLGLSDAIAFRVRFHGAEPRARDLYWRGPVLWATDGRRWSAGSSGDGPPGVIEPLGEAFRYTVTLEPHSMRWLLALELVTVPEPGMRRTSDFRLMASKRVRQRINYDLSSVVSYRARELSDRERQDALRLPAGWHPQARLLAHEWASQAATPLAIADLALKFYANNEFYYSLTPPLLVGDAVDEFLFGAREGFCEHFASSFVVLMRAAGVPARIVVGYQGGEYNSVGDYMVVRQRDAHAWAEIYDEDRGWVRIDPTAAVAPERVSLGIDTALPQRAGFAAGERGGVGSALWRQLRNSWDAITYGWNQWVLGYSPQHQRRLLDDFGLEDWDYGDLVITLTLAFALSTAVLGLYLLRSERVVTDTAQLAWLAYCAKLARLGLAREPAEAPKAYARRVMLARGDLAQEVARITQLYTQVRYGNRANSVHELERRVRQFKPKRRH